MISEQCDFDDFLSKVHRLKMVALLKAAKRESRDAHLLSQPANTTVYRVFLASSGGLQEERRAFREIPSEYNESEGLERGAIFVTVGWEETLGGWGRPQQKLTGI